MSTVNIKYGNNYKISSLNGIISVEFTDGNKLYEQTISLDKVSDKVLIDYCEERIVLVDGKKLKRVRDMLTVVN